jgi:uncharacterized protein (TIGR02270 family)
MRSIPDVLTQHAEEAAFLWLLRDRAVREPHYSLSDLVHLDLRVEAHIDGLRVAGSDGWEICKAALTHEEPGEVFAATVLAVEGEERGQVRDVWDVAIRSSETIRGFISALAWVPYDLALDPIHQLLVSPSPEARRGGIAAAAAHRWPVGEPLAQALRADDAHLRSRAFRAVGQLGTLALRDGLSAGLTDIDVGCRFWAAWSLVLLGDPQAMRVLKALAQADHHPHRAAAAATALHSMDLSAGRSFQRRLADDPTCRRIAIVGAGALGDPRLIPWLVQQMEDTARARLAGEAFSLITGVDLALQDLEAGWPHGFQVGPTEDPTDDNVRPDPDENLPWPNPEAVERWWSEHRKAFPSGTRYLLGQPIRPQSLQHVLKTGRQRQRAAAALELALSAPGQPLFDVRAPGFRQQTSLSPVD